jgi:hypothetical protein
MRYSYKQIREQQVKHFPNENSDCAVVALAVATDMTYKKAHALCKTYGRRDRCGMRDDRIRRTYQHLGYKWRPQYSPKQPNGNGYTMKTITKGFSDTGTYLVFTMSHMATIRETQLQDWSGDSRMRVVYVLKLTKQ